MILFFPQNSKGKATLVIPDVTTKTMERLLNLAYTGRMYYSQEEAPEIFSAMQCLYFAEFADLSMVKVTKVEKPACSFQMTGFLGKNFDSALLFSSCNIKRLFKVPFTGSIFQPIWTFASILEIESSSACLVKAPVFQKFD